jgi:hypothetical protein
VTGGTWGFVFVGMRLAKGARFGEPGSEDGGPCCVLLGRFATDSPAGGPSAARRFRFALAGWIGGGAPVGMT